MSFSFAMRMLSVCVILILSVNGVFSSGISVDVGSCRYSEFLDYHSMLVPNQTTIDRVKARVEALIKDSPSSTLVNLKGMVDECPEPLCRHCQLNEECAALMSSCVNAVSCAEDWSGLELHALAVDTADHAIDSMIYRTYMPKMNATLPVSHSLWSSATTYANVFLFDSCVVQLTQHIRRQCEAFPKHQGKTTNLVFQGHVDHRSIEHDLLSHGLIPPPFKVIESKHKPTFLANIDTRHNESYDSMLICCVVAISIPTLCLLCRLLGFKFGLQRHKTMPLAEQEHSRTHTQGNSTNEHHDEPSPLQPSPEQLRRAIVEKENSQNKQDNSPTKNKGKKGKKNGNNKNGNSNSPVSDIPV